MSTDPSPQVRHESFTCRRTYAAAPQRVWAALADPAAKRQWFAAPSESEVEHRMDFREGGVEEMSGRHGDNDFHYVSRFFDIVEGERLVYSYEMSYAGNRLSLSAASWELTLVDGGTGVVYTESMAIVHPEETADSRRAGTEALLDALGGALEA